MPRNDSRPHLVLFFTRDMSLRKWEQAGIFTREVALYERLAKQGIRVTFLTYGKGNELAYQGRLGEIKVVCNAWNLPRQLYRRWLPALHRRLLASCDLIKTNQMDGAEIAARVARRFGKPLIARSGYMWSETLAAEHGPLSRKARRADRIERRVWRMARRIVVTSPEMAARVRRRVPGSAPRIRVIPNYVDTRLFSPRAVGHDEEGPDVLFVGRLDPIKNLDLLLRAVARIGATLAVAGAGDAEPWRRAADAAGAQVDWLGALPHTELPNWMCRAKVVVLPSVREGQPKALLEAMACGAAVVGTAVPGIRDVVDHEQTGLLCEPNVDSLSRAVGRLLDDAGLRRRLGDAARAYVEHHFRLEEVAKNEFDICKELIDESRQLRAA